MGLLSGTFMILESRLLVASWPMSKLLTSTSAQIEVFTLLGIILNGIMQGYATANTIYVFLIEDLEAKIKRACGQEGAASQGMYEYHATKIHANL